MTAAAELSIICFFNLKKEQTTFGSTWLKRITFVNVRVSITVLQYYVLLILLFGKKNQINNCATPPKMETNKKTNYFKWIFKTIYRNTIT